MVACSISRTVRARPASAGEGKLRHPLRQRHHGGQRQRRWSADDPHDADAKRHAAAVAFAWWTPMPRWIWSADRPLCSGLCTGCPIAARGTCRGWNAASEACWSTSSAQTREQSNECRRPAASISALRQLADRRRAPGIGPLLTDCAEREPGPTARCAAPGLLPKRHRIKLQLDQATHGRQGVAEQKTRPFDARTDR